MYALNSAMKAKIFYLGEEQTPVIQFDDFLADINYLRRQLPGRDDFDEAQSFYPGIRALMPDAFVQFTLAQLEPKLRRLYDLPPQAALGKHYGVFSIVTRKPEELIIPQRIPHFDTSRPYYFAMLLYVAEGDFGGTAFYRHKASGYERISEARRLDFIAQVKAEVEAQGEPPRTYCCQGDPRFEQLLEIPYQANRLIVYPGNLLHSGQIDPARDLRSDPLQGRITANIFADFGLAPGPIVNSGSVA